MHGFKATIFLILFFSLNHSAIAWSDHAVLTNAVLENWAKQDKAAALYLNQEVTVESLQSFLQATQDKLPARLKEIEKELQANEVDYAPVPQAIAYQPDKNDCSNDIKVCFKKSLRINLTVPMVPTRIATAEKIRVADIISAASSQPDAGFDVFLYENNPTAFGKLYGFGLQPFGITTVPYGSQAFFHMSSYHEPKILSMLLPGLTTYPEYRAALYLQLSKFAAETSHPYWAAIFLGYGLHYIQDMTQPYHTSLSKGLTTSVVFVALVKKLMGNDKALSELTVIQTNRHLLLEKLTTYIMSSSAFDNAYYQKNLINALSESAKDTDLPKCDLTKRYLRDEIIPNIMTVSSANDVGQLLPSIANNLTFDANTYRDYEGLFRQEMNTSKRLQFNQEVAQFLVWYGAYTRNCIRSYGMPA